MNIEERDIKQLLHKYFRDECNHDELRTINLWLNNQENERHFNDIIDEYLLDQNVRLPHHITKIASWRSIYNKIKKYEDRKRSKINLHRLRQIAAALVFIVILSIIYFNISKNGSELTDSIVEKVATIKQTEKGQKRKFALPDGTLVTLNSASLLKIPPDFMGNNTRTVYLEGEAFFEVEKMQNLPFIVISGDLFITVLGTSFKIEAYPFDETKVTVLTGKVLVATNDINVELEPNQMAVYKEHEGILKTKYDHMVEFGWTDGILVFNKDDFEGLIRKLELWYGVDITVKGNAPKDTFSARYNNVSLEILLEGLSFSGDFTYKLDDKQLILEFK